MSENVIISQEYRIMQPQIFYQNRLTQQVIEVHAQQLHEFYQVERVQDAQAVAGSHQASAVTPWMELGERYLMQYLGGHSWLSVGDEAPTVQLWRLGADNSTLQAVDQPVGPFRMAPADVYQAAMRTEFGRGQVVDSLDALAQGGRRFSPDYYAVVATDEDGTTTWYPLEQESGCSLGLEWILFPVAGGVDVVEQLPGRTLYREAWEARRYFVRHDYPGEAFPLIDLIDPISAPLLGFAPVPREASAA